MIKKFNNIKNLYIRCNKRETMEEFRQRILAWQEKKFN